MSTPNTATPVSVAFITNAQGEILWVWDDEWGCFALAMTRPRVGASAIESPEYAARRAAARALGVPVRIGHHVSLDPEVFVSGRDLTRRRYRFDVYRAEAHPDFANRVVSVPHIWLAPHRALGNRYEPLSESCRWIVASLADQGFLPGRSQYTGALIIRRDHHDKQQFLLRREAGWGYALPTKRRKPEETYREAAERVAREELGLIPEKNVNLEPTRLCVVTSRDHSQSEQTETFYCHGVFDATLVGTPAFTSTAPLVWVDAKTIIAGAVRDHLTFDGKKAPDDRVSPTTVHILQELDYVPTIDAGLVMP